MERAATAPPQSDLNAAFTYLCARASTSSCKEDSKSEREMNFNAALQRWKPQASGELRQKFLEKRAQKGEALVCRASALKRLIVGREKSNSRRRAHNANCLCCFIPSDDSSSSLSARRAKRRRSRRRRRRRREEAGVEAGRRERERNGCYLAKESHLEHRFLSFSFSFLQASSSATNSSP